MAEPSERSPLLAESNRENRPVESSEFAPLLSNQDTEAEYQSEETQQQEEASSQPKSSPTRGWRWPSIIAGIILAGLIVAVLLCGFLLPGAVKVYAENAAVLEPRSLSVESITNDGVKARIQAEFRLDGSRVSNQDARRIGRVTTSIMRKLSTEEAHVKVYAPHYDNALVGSVAVPPLTIDIVDGHSTVLDFVTDLVPGEANNIRTIANSWLDGKLDELKLTGTTAITLKSGIIPLGTHDVVESMVFEGRSLYRSFAAVYFGEKSIS